MSDAPHILIVEARFYDDLLDAMLDGAKRALQKAGATCEVVTVPGALEIPAAIRFALETRRFDGFIALGCIIRGETTHYETVCEESARGLTWLALEHKAAIGNGILTVETEEQAWARAGNEPLHNKGAQAAQAVLSLVALKKHFNLPR